MIGTRHHKKVFNKDSNKKSPLDIFKQAIDKTEEAKFTEKQDASS